MLKIGTHMSVAGGIVKAAEATVAMGANTMQIFSRNPRGSGFKVYEEKEIKRFREIREEHGFAPILAHAPYTMNLASDKEEVYAFACSTLKEDVARMDRLGIELFVFHPGSHTGIGVEKGIDNIIKGLNEGLTGQEKIRVLLETMSGKGTEIGSRFEELKEILEGVTHKEQMGICLDTCHVFSAGYDIQNNLEQVLEEFDRILGLDLLKAIHLNDSKMPFAARKDRHAVTGEGEIGWETLRRVISHPKLRHLPFYLETPLDDKGHKEEIANIRKRLGEEGDL